MGCVCDNGTSEYGYSGVAGVLSTVERLSLLQWLHKYEGKSVGVAILQRLSSSQRFSNLNVRLFYMYIHREVQSRDPTCNIIWWYMYYANCPYSG